MIKKMLSAAAGAVAGAAHSSWPATWREAHQRVLRARKWNPTAASARAISWFDCTPATLASFVFGSTRHMNRCAQLFTTSDSHCYYYPYHLL